MFEPKRPTTRTIKEAQDHYGRQLAIDSARLRADHEGGAHSRVASLAPDGGPHPNCPLCADVNQGVPSYPTRRAPRGNCPLRGRMPFMALAVAAAALCVALGGCAGSRRASPAQAAFSFGSSCQGLEPITEVSACEALYTAQKNQEARDQEIHAIKEGIRESERTGE